jgi:hypothetical protein
MATTGKQLDDGDADGTCLGQSTTSKIGFYGLTTCIAQGATIATGTDLTTTLAAVNSVIARLQALNLIA